MDTPLALQVPAELEKLLPFVKGKRLILEIGTAQGGTLYQIMQRADPWAEIVAIDLPGGAYGGELGQPDVATMQRWRQQSQILHVLRADSRAPATVELVKDILRGRKFDFVMIDGDHSYEGVKGDFEAYLPLSEGLIVFHDIAHHAQADVGVERFWQELCGDKTEIIEDPKQGWAGIGIYRVHTWLGARHVLPLLRHIRHPLRAFDVWLEKRFVALHGRGAPHQELFYRCDTCGRVITWNKIRSGKICCGGKVVETDLRPLEIFRLFLLPRSV